MQAENVSKLFIRAVSFAVIGFLLNSATFLQGLTSKSDNTNLIKK